MKLIKRIQLKFWRTLAGRRHRYVSKYATLSGVRLAEGTKFTGLPDFGTEPWLIEIGPNCLITQNVRFMTHDGSVSIVRRLGEPYKDLMKFGKIIVEDNAFIGANTVIMPSVRIGSHAVIAACSCVTKDVPSGEVWGGVPARRIGTVQELADKLLLIGKGYLNDAELMKRGKKEISTAVAEEYWKYNHT